MKKIVKNNGITKKRSVDKAINFLLDIRLTIIIAAILCFLLFKTPIEDALNRFLVIPILQHVEQIWYNDLLLFLLILLSVVRSIIQRRSEKAITKFSNEDAVFIFIGIVYLGYRVTNSTWDFTPTYLLPQIKYTDFYVIILVLNFTIPRFIASSSKKVKPLKRNKDEFFQDIELSKNDPDLLGYEPYAKQIAEKIKITSVNKSFAIGINAKWGQGKSSFMNLIRKHIPSDEILEVDFKPWFSNTPDTIIKDFFELLIDRIGSRNKSLTSLLKRYAEKLLAANSSTSLQLVLDVLRDTGDEPVSNMYKEINDELETLNKKTIVYIDDMDRLNNEEIIEVIKLIRNTANFVNTYYIVAYDRDYVVAALKNHTDFRRQEFLEKIFQLEVSLPGFKNSILKGKLIENLKQQLSDKLHEKIDEEINGTKVTQPEYLDDWLESMRDVTRLSNSISLNYKELEEDVVFGDFLKLELLRVKYPWVYHLISRRKSNFFENSSKKDGKMRYFLKQDGHDLNQESTITSLLEKYLIDDMNGHCLSLIEIQKVVSLVANIFGFNKDTWLFFEDRSELSIVYPSKFDRYFTYRLLEGEISNKGFSGAMELTQEDLNNQISTWIGKGMESELKVRFIDLKEFDNKEQYEKHIKAIFYLANIKREKSESKDDYIGFNFDELINKLIPGGPLNAKKYYDGDDEKLHAFVKGIFESANPPFYFESQLLARAKRIWIDDFILSHQEMDDLTQDYFSKYTNEVDEITSDVWHLYYCCKNFNRVPTGDSSYQIEEVMPVNANKIMREFVLRKDPETFVKQITNPQMAREDFLSINPQVRVIFGTWDNFYSEIEDLQIKSPVLTEFFEFLKLCKAVDFKEYVKFSFANPAK